MPKRIRLRALTADEKAEIRRLAASRKESIRLVQRARIIAAMDEDAGLTATEAGLRAGYKSNALGARWVNRFIEEGLAGLEDRPRSGRRPIHSQGVRSALIDLALRKPRSLGYPFELWTLERLQRAIDRVVHHSLIIEFGREMKSVRAEEAARRNRIRFGGSDAAQLAER